MRDTLKRADLVYANLEGLLVTSKGTKIDIPDKPEWTHPGPSGAGVLKANNIAVVGVANNVASGRENILKSLSVLDANGIIHTGAGRNIDEAAVLADIRNRDERDQNRAIAPLKQAPDAHLLDTTHLDIDAAFAAAKAYLSRR